MKLHVSDLVILVERDLPVLTRKPRALRWVAKLDLEGASSPVGFGHSACEAVKHLMLGMLVSGQLARCFGSV